MPKRKKTAAAAGDSAPAAEGKSEETREQKLCRLASARVSAALKRLDLVGNLAAYKPTEKQANAILGALVNRLNTVSARLKGAKSSEGGFALPME